MFETETVPKTSLLATFAALSLVLLYLFSLRHYGFELSDEGTILYQIDRAAAGQIPYRDFATGYTPGFFWLNAMVFRTMGENVASVRLFLILVHSFTALGLLLIASRIVKPPLALFPALLWFAFLPVFPGRFCSFNIPYPAWYATAAFLWTAFAAMRWRETGRNGWLAAAAGTAAIALACKPNSGAFAFCALAMVVLRTRQGTVDFLWWPVWASIIGVVGLAFGFRVVSFDFALYPLPLLVFLVLLAAGRLRTRLSGDLGIGAAWVAMAMPACVITLPWVALFLGLLGPRRFVREVALIGSGADAIYYIPFPAVGRVATAAALTLCAIGALGLILRGVSSSRAFRALIGASVAFGGAGAVAVAAGATMPEGIAQSIIWQLEAAAFPLSLAVNWVGLGLAGSGPARASEGAGERNGWPLTRIEVLLAFALCMFLQLYPRADFMHLVTAAPLTLVLGLSLLDKSVEGWQRAFEWLNCHLLARWGKALAAAAFCAILLLRLAPNLHAIAGLRHVAIHSTRGKIETDAAGSDLFDDLAETVKEVARLTDPGEAVFTFPALAAVNFFAERGAPFRHDYFFPGRPDHEDEARMVDVLRALPPRLAVAMNRDLGFFVDSPAYYLLLRDFVQSHYRPLRRVGRFDILMLNFSRAADGATLSTRRQATPVAEARQPATALAADDRRQLLYLASETRAPEGRRRAALLTLLRELEESPGGDGLKDSVAAAGLSRSQELLLLRGIRDHGDVRATEYLVAKFEGKDRRLKSEAESAMQIVGARITASGFLWGRAGKPEVTMVHGATDLRPRLAGWLDRPLVSLRAQEFAARVLGLIGDRSTRSQLVRAFSKTRARRVRVAIAAALVRLGDDDLSCALVNLLGRLSQPLRDLAPSLVLESYRRSPRVVRPCVTRAIRLGLGAKEGTVPWMRAREAIWVAAAAHDSELREVLEAAAAGSDALSAAARWAIEHTEEDLGG